MPECSYCEGRGCSECDGKGMRYHATEVLEDGTVIHISGSGDGPSEATRAALRLIAQAAIKRLEQA